MNGEKKPSTVARWALAATLAGAPFAGVVAGVTVAKAVESSASLNAISGLAAPKGKIQETLTPEQVKEIAAILRAHSPRQTFEFAIEGKTVRLTLTEITANDSALAYTIGDAAPQTYNPDTGGHRGWIARGTDSDVIPRR